MNMSAAWQWAIGLAITLAGLALGWTVRLTWGASKLHSDSERILGEIMLLRMEVKSLDDKLDEKTNDMHERVNRSRDSTAALAQRVARLEGSSRPHSKG